MGSLVHDLQNDIRKPGKSVVEILRTAKLISSKLGLNEISEWLDAELNGYPTDERPPPYRYVIGGILEIRNPVLGWTEVGPVPHRFANFQPVSELEELAKHEGITLTPKRKFKLDNQLYAQCPQRVEVSPIKIKAILEAIKEKILDWSIELEQRGILGESMSFDKDEKQAARGQTFHIQNATGVFGNVTKSSVTIYDYSSVHQSLKEAGVPQEARNEIENIMDELKSANPEQKKSLIERGKQWIVDNEKLLGAGASIVRKALGVGD